MIIQLNTRKQKETYKMKDKQHVVIAGWNGVGKTQYLKSLIDPMQSLIILKKWNEIKVNYNTSLSTLITNKKRWHYFDQAFTQFLDKDTLDLNKIIENHKRNTFAVLNDRFIKYYNQFAKNAFDSNSKGESFLARHEDYPILRIKSLLEDFLEDKIIDGLTDNRRQIQIIDLDGEKKTLTELSDGEKIIFALSAEILENEDKGMVYIWDEPETYLHPRWQSKILEFLEKSFHKSSIIMVSHSPHLILQAQISNKTALVKLSRNKEGIDIKDLDLRNDFKMREALGINEDFINKVIDIQKNTIFVEGESDKIYLNALGYENVTPMNGSGSVHSIIQYMRIKNNVSYLMVLDNDAKKHLNKKDKEENEKCIFLPERKDNEDIEKYIQFNILKVHNDFKIISNYSDKGIELLSKNIREKNLKTKDDLIKYEINKIGFISSKYFICKDGSFKLPSKVEMANFIVENHLNELKTWIEPLKIQIDKQL